ncbi:hypothetical protein FA13DRAFT_1818193 [Coprinellus micaceus]|uniref:Nephrocystin 3-like N-terminal domain-containing protein n=1 Tax=Coprinellus micaceus TaxID=71717 RepID=A0A4Y7SQA1_COPMI|nr:hypothetical protein FA13DRAFT_1818193 [Coprinellus micaceus]
MSSGKQNLLSRVLNKFQNASRPQEAITPAAHAPSGSQAHERSTAFEEEMREATRVPSQVPAIWVQDHSKHHYGDTTYHTHGTANFVGSVAHAAFGPNSATTIERAFFSSGNGEFEKAVLLWDTLPKQRDTVVQQNEYLEESREDVVQDVLGWSKDPTSELALFIVGAAGVGKSTLARHLTYRLHALGQFAAFVSLSTLPSDARSPENVVKLASREIGGTHPEAIPAILEAIKSCKGAPLVEHVEMFIVESVRSLCLPHSLMVIFDAVDEYEFHATLVKALLSLPLSSSSSIKFVFLGRSDPRTRGIGNGSIRPYPLRPVSIPVMERFLTSQFNGVRWEHGRRPAPFHVTKLAELTNGLFIWATVVCSLLKKRLSRFPPDHILKSILDARKTLGDGEQLATLYHHAITLLFPDSDSREILREYLTATLALQESLPMDEFSAFTNLPTRAIESIQAELKALQIRKPGGAEDEGAQVHPAGSLFHLSFLEYLESTSTPPAIAFHVSMFSSHSQLAQFCFKELPRFLPSPHPLRLLDLDPRGRYAVTNLMTHIHYGSPLVQPDSSEEWKRSTLCATLRQTSLELLWQWADLLVDLAKPVGELCMYPDDSQDTGSDPKEPNATEGSEDDEDHDEQDAGREGDEADLTGSDHSSGTREDIDKLDALEFSDDHGPDLDEQQAGSDSESGELSWGNADHEDMEHDNRVAQLLYVVAATLKNAYISQLSPQTGCMEVAVRLRPDDAENWCFLGWTYYTAALWSRSPEAYDRGITAHRNALQGVDKYKAEDPGRLPYGLATALYKRFWEFGRPEDIDQAVAHNRDGLAMRPPGHPMRGMSLNNLANSLSTYVRERGSSLSEIDKVIGLRREALNLLPHGHEVTSSYLCNLSIDLRYRYEMTASIVDLEETLRLGRKALALRPLGHADRARHLHELAWDLTSLYEVQGNSEYLGEAILLARESLSLCPTTHPDRWDTLDTLSNALRFHPDHLDEALQLSRESLSLIPLNHSYRWEVMSTFASILRSHYELSGSAEDLEEATSVCEQALTLCPPNHVHRPKLVALKAKLVEANSSSSFKS